MAVGNRRLVADLTRSRGKRRPNGSAKRQDLSRLADALEAQGKTLLFVTLDGQLAGILAAADTRRPEVPAALAELRTLGIRHIELLTGDNEQAANALAAELGIPCRANLLPEDKIRIVQGVPGAGSHGRDGRRRGQRRAGAGPGRRRHRDGRGGLRGGHRSRHVALMRDDWMLVPEVFRIAQRTMRVVRMNLGFTGVYNVVGLSLAAFGILPPILAAAAQSLPDLGILGNSARLLRQK